MGESIPQPQGPLEVRPADRAVSSWTDIEKINFCQATNFTPRPFAVFLSGQNSSPLPTLKSSVLSSVLRSSLSTHTHLTDVRYTRAGLLLLKTNHYECAKEILRMTTLGETPVMGRLAADSVQTDFLIRDVDDSITAADILDAIQGDDAHFAEVRRFSRIVDGRRLPSSTVLLAAIGIDDLNYVSFFFRRYRCSLFIPRPRACTRCQAFGHTSKVCRGNLLCGRCGDRHATSDCPSPTARCCRCRGSHLASDPACPKVRAEAERLRTAALQRIPTSQQARRVARPTPSYATATATPPPHQPPPVRPGPDRISMPKPPLDSTSTLLAAIQDLTVQLKECITRFKYLETTLSTLRTALGQPSHPDHLESDPRRCAPHTLHLRSSSPKFHHSSLPTIPPPKRLKPSGKAVDSIKTPGNEHQDGLPSGMPERNGNDQLSRRANDAEKNIASTSTPIPTSTQQIDEPNPQEMDRGDHLSLAESVKLHRRRTRLNKSFDG